MLLYSYPKKYERSFNMQKKKLEKKDKVLLGVLAALIVIVIAVGVFLIVKNTNSANEQTNGITSSAASGEINSSSQTSSNADSKSSDKKSSDSKSNNSAVNSSSSASDNSQNGGANTPSNSSKKKTSSKATSKTSSKAKVKGDKVKRVKPKDHTSHATNKTLSVNGKSCYVGDTITVVMNITSNKSIVNYQGALKFDDSYLKIKDVKSNEFGLANASGNEVMYNASNLNGMNFSETGTVFTATFEVLKTGSTKLDNNLEIISELIDNNIKQLAPSEYKATIEVYD